MQYTPRILALTIFGSVFLFMSHLFGGSLLYANNATLVINEIAAYEQSKYEWIEIYNTSNEPIDIEDWKFWENDTNHSLELIQGDDYIIEPNEYAIIAENTDNFLEANPNVTSTLFDSSWGTINESGEEIGLKDASDEFIEQFTYIAAPNFSLERKNPHEAVYDETNWQEHPDSNTVGQKNFHAIEGPQEETNPPEETPSEQESIIITEFVSNPSEGENEWIELHNQGTIAVSLTGWKLEDGVGSIAELTQTVDAEGYIVVELSSNKLNNTGDIIILKNTDQTIVESIAYGTWDDGNTEDNISTPPKGSSMSRQLNDSWTETTKPTKGVQNTQETTTEVLPEEEPSTEQEEPTSGGGSEPTPPTYNPRDIVINELVSDPADGQEEFVELINNTNSVINLDDWWIEEGSETKTTLSGDINPGGFNLIEKPKGNLNNSGDTISIFSPNGTTIDQVTYGNWDDGNKSDNAPAPEDPLSLARKIDGQDSNNDFYDFALTNIITKGTTNIITNPSTDPSVNTSEEFVSVGDIVISEIFPNPKGSDNDTEFIELQNVSNKTINLTDWKLGDSTTKRWTISKGILKPNEYIVFKRSATSIALNNSGGDEVKLFSPAGTLIHDISYDIGPEEESYAQREDGTYTWTTKITMGKQNIIEGKNAAPLISIDVDTEVAVGEPVLFDASDTTDPDGETMSFSWNFGDDKEDEGDVVEYRYTKEGVYTVILTVTDKSNNTSKKQVIITVKNRLDFTGGYLKSFDLSQIDISEILPNPEGSDSTEFIELYNPTTKDIDVSNIKIDDEEGGSRAFTIPENVTIAAGTYMIFGRQDTKIALNNTSDSVRLLYPDGTVIKEIRYDDVEEGASYIHDENGIGIWTGTITPGTENIISPIKSTARTASTRTTRSSKYVKPLINTTLTNIRDEDIGDNVSLSGVVVVLPKTYSTQYFYIVDPKNKNAGIQVYMYKKDFPKLSIGDVIQITGEISQASGNTRVKISQKSDIKIIDHVSLPTGRTVDIQDIAEPLEAQLVKIHGEITEIKTSYMYVDDGTDEVKVYFKRGAGINKKLFQLGDLVHVTGIVQQTKTDYQLLPRSQSDIEKTGTAESAVIHKETKTENNEKEVAEKYLTATAGGLTSILIGLAVRARGAAASDIVKKIGLVAVGVIRRKKG